MQGLSDYEGPNEPQAECPKCHQYRSLRWFQQSTVDEVEIGDRRYGAPVGVCASCHKGQARGPRKAMIGKLFEFDAPEQPHVPSWEREARLRTFFGLD